MKERTIILRELLAEEQVVAPCVFDNISVRAVELAGYKAAVLSGAGLAYSMCGVSDMGLLNAEELLWMTNRLTDYTPLPVIVDAGNGYGESPSAVYLTALRLAKSGAMAITVDDTTGICGTDRSFAADAVPVSVVSFDTYLAKIKAAVKACENTECIVIAKMDASVYGSSAVCGSDYGLYGGTAARTHFAAGRGAEAHPRAERLPVPPALPVCNGHLSKRKAVAVGIQTESLCRLS